MTFRVAFGWSTLLHVGILALRPPAGLVPPASTLHPLDVTLLPARSIEIPRPAAKEQAPPPDPRPASQESRSVAEERKPPRPPSRPAPVERDHPAPLPALPTPPARPAPPPPSSARRGPAVEAPPGAGASATGLPERVFASIEHKERVREHLRKRMRYPFPRVEGRVLLQIWLGSGGNLQQATVLQASDPRLAAAALEDVRAAAPYPRFPSTLREPRARYDFLVKYEPE